MLSVYCISVMSMITLVGKRDKTGFQLSVIRHNITKNLPKDIKGFKNKGKSKEQIIDYYWRVKAFRELWCSYLEYEKEDLVKFVRA